MAELSKFDELRIKTGGQLVHLVNHELELGVREARQALGSSKSRAVAEDHYLKAKRTYAEVSRLIPLVDEIPQDQRGSWEARLAQLREMLEELSVLNSRRTAVPARPSVRAERALSSQREFHAVS
jgi:hypothetical protein